MTRNEFALQMKGKQVYDILPEEVATWFKLFKNMPREYEVKILGDQAKINLGKALAILREKAYYQFFVMNRRKVEIFPGCCLVSNRDPDAPLRKKYREMIPDKMSKKECMKLVNSFGVPF